MSANHPGDNQAVSESHPYRGFRWPAAKRPALTFDDLALGDEWESPARTVTEADVVAFAGLSGDFNPIHVDHEVARQGPFGRPVAHGLLGLAIAQRPGQHCAPGRTRWPFSRSWNGSSSSRSPSATPSTSYARRVGRAWARGRRGVVTWHRRLVNQHGEDVQEGLTQTLVQGGPGTTSRVDPAGVTTGHGEHRVPL